MKDWEICQVYCQLKEQKMKIDLKYKIKIITAL